MRHPSTSARSSWTSASSDSSSQRYLRFMFAMFSESKRGNFRIPEGLSETSASLKLRGLGSGSDG